MNHPKQHHFVWSVLYYVIYCATGMMISTYITHKLKITNVVLDALAFFSIYFAILFAKKAFDYLSNILKLTVLIVPVMCFAVIFIYK